MSMKFYKNKLDLEKNKLNQGFLLRLHIFENQEHLKLKDRYIVHLQEELESDHRQNPHFVMDDKDRLKNQILLHMPCL